VRFTKRLQTRQEASAATLVQLICSAHYRRRGLAAWLVRECEDEARRRGAPVVKAFVRASNAGAIRLYAEAGWRIARPTLNVQQEGYVMSKDLSMAD